jgi:hypothetical protein
MLAAIASGVRLPSMNGNASATAAMTSVTAQGPRATVVALLRCRRGRWTNGASGADSAASDGTVPLRRGKTAVLIIHQHD